MDLGLTGRVAVVTGGSSGIGLATARRFLDDGASVVICGRDRDRLSSAVAELGGGDRLHAEVCDVLDPDAMQQLADSSATRFGEVDILVNNAGQARLSTFASTLDADWDAELRLKFFSVINPTRAFLPLLQASGAGAIVVVNSLLARQPEPHMVCTSAARAGVQNLVKSLSVELAPNVRVNSILIGTVNSGQWQRRYAEREDDATSYSDWLAGLARKKGIPLERFGEPEETAAAVVFLASPAAGFITGAALEVAGGVSRFA